MRIVTAVGDFGASRGPDFEDRYAALTIEKMREDGATAAAVAAKEQEMARFTELYAKPAVTTSGGHVPGSVPGRPDRDVGLGGPV